MRNIYSLYKRWVVCLFFSVLMVSCAIENDIPYPILEASIEAIEVEGQRGAEDNIFTAATINKTSRTVTLYVNDSVDINKLKITRLKITEDAELIPDSAACIDYAKFPNTGFASLDSISISSNTRVNFSSPVNFTLRTYQDYVWRVTVNQIVEREIDVVGMTDNYVLDANSRRVIIYVGSDQDLSNIQINKLNLGGEYGSVKPDPTTVHDFTTSQTFYAARHGQDTWQEWKVFVYQTEEGASTGSSNVFPMTTKAILKGSIQSGKTPVIEYATQSESSWKTVPPSDISISGTSYTATISGLKASTTYKYRVSVDGTAGSEQTFTTVAAVALENGKLENWSQDGKVWNPYSADANPFWGTGNPGAANFIGNLTEPTDESISGKAALLETKNAIIKLGAGNLFTGDFALDGLNGLLHFGRPFTSFPSALRLYYKYTSTTINMIGDNVGDLASLKGEPDMCQIYIALSDKSEPYEIKNDPKNRKLFDPQDPNIIAYGEFTSNQTTSSYKQIEIPLEYRYTGRTPKYIIIVASSSKYGDYYIGGVGSKLWLDEMELVYE